MVSWLGRSACWSGRQPCRTVFGGVLRARRRPIPRPRPCSFHPRGAGPSRGSPQRHPLGSTPRTRRVVRPQYRRVSPQEHPTPRAQPYESKREGSWRLVPPLPDRRFGLGPTCEHTRTQGAPTSRVSRMASQRHLNAWLARCPLSNRQALSLYPSAPVEAHVTRDSTLSDCEFLELDSSRT